MSLSREAILAKQDDLPVEDVPVPEWGDDATIRVRGLSSQARWDWAMQRQKAVDGDGGPEPTSFLVALAAVDDNGARLFQAQDADAIANLRGDVVERVADVVMQLSGLTEKAKAAAAGNSDATQSGDSLTDSPATSDAPSPN